MHRSKPPYPAEYRSRIVELARSGRTIRSLAKEFGVTDTTIRSAAPRLDVAFDLGPAFPQPLIASVLLKLRGNEASASFYASPTGPRSWAAAG